ncbi:hypothetical protein BU23DRAFT_602703 [Bimuria novae-zelandiae CBS 107.79]|uniref:Uncharacterized protein n=1 Tax=Bimuria novae-zelandiae CBS 107.79 TaxID=1447943 RepID=A0A6A5USL7_9PLEO|nr:hypothetical protein BU23DRAFT_602703 [Bimuria novae-zelandiae CBS 107.79]
MAQRSHHATLPGQGQPPKGSSVSPHCCVQAAIQMNNLYHHVQAQLQNTLAQLQTTQNQLRHTHIQKIEIQEELESERGACELVNQQFLELKQNHDNLQKDQEEAVALRAQLTKSMVDYRSYAEEVTRQAEKIINDLRTRTVEGEVGGTHDGQSISAMILQSARNTLLVEATTRGYSETDILDKLKHVMDQNVEFQLENERLSEALEAQDRELEARDRELEARDRELEARDRKLEARDKEMEARDMEMASLNKALELTTEEGKQARSRRGGKQRKLMPRVDST